MKSKKGMETNTLETFSKNHILKLTLDKMRSLVPIREEIFAKND
jgi:hypothetical protein